MRQRANWSRRLLQDIILKNYRLISSNLPRRLRVRYKGRQVLRLWVGRILPMMVVFSAAKVGVEVVKTA